MEERRRQRDEQRRRQQEASQAARRRNEQLLQDLRRLEEEVRGQQLPRPHLQALEVTSQSSSANHASVLEFGDFCVLEQVLGLPGRRRARLGALPSDGRSTSNRWSGSTARQSQTEARHG
ncbi:unnamed protein product [Tetraodon nigroviridis]|uniref:(spotted green pufferfish) hypothetical protein n=1 Tax=Tetraodon nigroviridis TaxID=99883 RepID=Q4TCL7_TETNG|nr:unnamed protein product [Tetraodon nigroviridis]